MPVCALCGSEDFDEHGGLFFCLECSTQSQEVRVEEQEEELLDAGVWRSGEIWTRKKREPAQESKKDDKGRPWSIYEAYQIVIQQQVEALIKLGADPSLKEVVLRLWMTYLSKLGVAFSHEQKSERLQKLERLREKSMGTVDDPSVKNVMLAKKRKRLGLTSKKQDEEDFTLHQLRLSIEGEEFYEGDNPFSDAMSEESESLPESELTGMNTEQSGKKAPTAKHFEFYPEKMTLQRTLCFCYLGLMFTNKYTMTSDLLRFVRCRKVPYLNVVALIPEELKFYNYDNKLFRDTLPTLENLKIKVGQLAFFLGISKFPSISICEVISKYILELDLPGELHCLVISLMNSKDLILQYKPVRVNMKVPFWEGIALAAIIMTLKLLFGLNDETEILLSKYAKQIEELQQGKSDVHLFVWDNWVTHIEKKIKRLQQSQNTSVNIDPETGLLHVYGRENLRQTVRTIKKQRTLRDETIEAIQKPFLTLSKRWTDREDQTFEASSSRGQSDSDASQQFRCSTLKYITHKDSFLDELDQQSTTDVALNSPESSFSHCSSQGEEEGDVQSSHRPTRRCKMLTKAVKQVRSRSHSGRQTAETASGSELTEHEIVREVQSTLEDVHRKFILSKKTKQVKQSQSFVWLIKLCSTLIGADEGKLLKEAQKLELVLFIKLEKTIDRGRFIMQNVFSGKHRFRKSLLREIYD